MFRFLSKISLFAKIFKECRELNLGPWQCPTFVFFVLGIINIAAMIATYLIAKYYTEPEYVALIVIGVSVFFFLISYSVTQGFDQLAQANKMKTEFVSIASHQLRTPLSAMRWTINLLEDNRVGEMGSEQKKYLELVKEGNERMIKLVNDLLDVSRIEMGRVLLQPGQTNLYVLIEKTVKDLSEIAKQSNIEIKLEAEETLPNVYVDPGKLSMVIQNLIDNAIKYSRGRGEIKIKAEKDGKFVKVAIQDQGVGIPQNQQKQIFQKFFRSDNALKNQTAGTGLGLFIAKSVVEESKGKIWFESKLDQGTTFFFTLPIYSL